MTQHEMEELSAEQCWALLTTATVGRFIYSDADGPAAVPVNYSVTEDELVIRVGHGSHLREVLDGPSAFEVDDLHAQDGTGWSVLVRGSARELPLDQAAELIRHLEHVPQPAVEGVHNVWLVLTPTGVTGRRLGGRSDSPVPLA